MDTPLRPTLSREDFENLVPKEELFLIMRSVTDAVKMTFDTEGIDPFIPQFRAIYSSCLFPRIWGMLAETFATSPDWEVKKSPMTFTLIKKGVCQFHFYKGKAGNTFKAVSNRQKAIVQGELYGDLENLPSIILQHFADRMNAELVGFHALFFARGKQVSDFDIMHSIILDSPMIGTFSQEQPARTDAQEPYIRFKPKKTGSLNKKRKNEDGESGQLSNAGIS